jgi:hypothetical protein
MPETHVVRFWHPSGMRFLSAIITGGIARQASLWPCPLAEAGTRSWPLLWAIACGDAICALPRSVNHRLKSGKPPACPSGLASNAAFAITAAFAEIALPQNPANRVTSV